MAAIVDVIVCAFRVKAEGQVFMPPKVMITWSDEPGTEETHGRIMAMPAYVGGEFDVAGLKWIPSVPDNPARRGLPRANALVLLSDRETGLPLAVMDGTVVSAMRTGAVTGVAVRHLAAGDERRACLLGAGVLAHTQLDALRVVMPALGRVDVYDPDRRRARRFCSRQAEATGLEMRSADTAEQAVRGAQGVVPADGSQAVELSDVVAGRHPGRTSPQQRIVVSPVGLAMDDVTTAKHVLDNAVRLGIGTELRLRSGPPVWE